MQTVTIHTTQNIDIDYEIASLGDRVLARLIDYGIFFVLAIIIGIGGVAALGDGPLVGFIFVGLFALFVFYDLICEAIFNGQSAGKRIMKIKVISLDGARPSFGQYLMRWLFRLVDFAITGQLGGLICAASTKNIQRIGDIVAGTVLIKTTPRTKMEHIVFKPSEDTYEPVFKETSMLGDKDVALVGDVINTYYKTGNAVVVYNMAARIKTHLNITAPENMNDLVFLQTIVKDYSHITAQTDAM
ncbi:RDD family protein [Mucilaginibacter gynuensis]|uniref:RDD family protein n=1 Tax=Mucilaginibacter gynuensis TaxID=1302236 RepID=A0ABP8GX59_9SPHI